MPIKIGTQGIGALKIGTQGIGKAYVGSQLVWQKATGSSLKTGLQACWELDEASGTTSYDSHGSNDGSITGCTVNQAGKINKAYEFNGTSSSGGYVNYPTPSTLGIASGDFSVSLWFFIDAEPRTTAELFNNRFGTLVINDFIYEYRWYSSTNKLQILLIKYPSNVLINFYSSALALDTWYHAVVTFNRTTRTMSLYVNSSADGSGAHSSSYDGFTFKDNSVTIGAIKDNSTLGGYTDGLMDQVAVWTRVLTTDDISALYNSGSGLAYSSW